MGSERRGLLSRLTSLRDSDGAFITVRSGPVFEDHSYRDVVRRAEQVAGFLQTKGVGCGDIVFLVLRSGIDAYAAFIGTMFVGAVPSYLPFPSAKQDPVYWAKTHREVFLRSRARCVIAYSELAPDIVATCHGLDTEVFDVADVTASGAPYLPVQTGQGLALLQHSSGTTGLKKGVALSYDAIELQLASYETALDLDALENFTIASWLPLYHDMGLISSFLLPLYRASRLISLDPFEWIEKPATLFEAIETYAATHSWLPNFAFQHLVRVTPPKARYDLGSVKALISCSEPCKGDSFRRFEQRFGAWGIHSGKLSCCYAMAETVFAVSQLPPGSPARSLYLESSLLGAGETARICDKSDFEVLSNGPPVEGMCIEIMAGSGRAGENVVGEIRVKAPFLFEGYFENETATTAAFDKGFFLTGDLGFINSGELFILGRIKDLIILNGKNVYAHDVEAIVSETEGIKPGRAVAFGVFDSAVGSERLIVMAEMMSEQIDVEAAIRTIAERVQNRLGVAINDIRIVAPGLLLKTTSGKISRAHNLSRYLDLTFRDAAQDN